MAKKKAKKFNYAVGFYWKKDENDSVGVYAYGGELHYGTMEDAKGLLEYVQEQEKLQPKARREEYRIFQLVEVPI
jgi:hypothetical protein